MARDNVGGNNAEAISTDEYLKRGRLFLGFSDERIETLWSDSVRLVQSNEGGPAAVLQMEDAAAEMRLRGLGILGDGLVPHHDGEPIRPAVEPFSERADLVRRIAEFCDAHRWPADEEKELGGET